MNKKMTNYENGNIVFFENFVYTEIESEMLKIYNPNYSDPESDFNWKDSYYYNELDNVTFIPSNEHEESTCDTLNDKILSLVQRSQFITKLKNGEFTDELINELELSRNARDKTIKLLEGALGNGMPVESLETYTPAAIYVALTILGEQFRGFKIKIASVSHISVDTLQMRIEYLGEYIPIWWKKIKKNIRTPKYGEE